MAISYQVFDGISGVALAGAAINGAGSIALSKTRRAISARGDGEVFDSVAAAGACSVAGTIVMTDAAAAMALEGKAGTLTFAWKPAGSSTTRPVTISGVSVVGIETRVGKGRASEARINFTAASSDGLGDPVQIS
ncbi:MAG: hypothetical protein ABFD92_09200 [Planctomycetaceae bacterium]|nr:hypothetical protein [Planctomycetaceae bacterium]